MLDALPILFANPYERTSFDLDSVGSETSPYVPWVSSASNSGDKSARIVPKRFRARFLAGVGESWDGIGRGSMSFAFDEYFVVSVRVFLGVDGLCRDFAPYSEESRLQRCEVLFPDFDAEFLW